MEANHIEKEVVKLLLNIGITNAGYEYYKKSLLICLKEDVVYYGAFQVFNWTAEYFNVSVEKITRSMRSAIDKAENLNILYNINELYGVKVLYSRPTISELFYILIEYLKVFKDCELLKV